LKYLNFTIVSDLHFFYIDLPANRNEACIDVATMMELRNDKRSASVHIRRALGQLLLLLPGSLSMLVWNTQTVFFILLGGNGHVTTGIVQLNRDLCF